MSQSSAGSPKAPARRAGRVIAYCGLAYLFSWAVWVPMMIQGQVSRPGQGWPTHLLGLLGPALAALVVTAAVEGRPGVTALARRTLRWRGVGRWYWAVGAILLVGAGAVAVLALTGAKVPSVEELSTYSGAPVTEPLLLLGYVLVVNGFGEEIGWRGFLAEELLTRHRVLPTAVVTALIWAGWHLPLFWVVESFRAMGWTSLGWLVGLVCGSIVLTWMYHGSGRSILLVALWHTAYNVTSATQGTHGIPAAATSTAVMVAAITIAVVELRRRAGA
ncbi:MAG TPA: CPBP family intramembrane glutamic endopeptidase [Candidatus Lustribacter sp.]|nr:CPBP family intramembrane glutamic endopeptidase [Candidatus Lustribacter sp.]